MWGAAGADGTTPLFLGSSSSIPERVRFFRRENSIRRGSEGRLERVARSHEDMGHRNTRRPSNVVEDARVRGHLAWEPLPSESTGAHLVTSMRRKTHAGHSWRPCPCGLFTIWIDRVQFLRWPAMVVRTAGGLSDQECPRSCRQRVGSSFDSIYVKDFFAKRCTMWSCQYFMRGRLRQRYAVALRERNRATEVGEERAWKVSGLVPCHVVAPSETRDGSVWSRRADQACKRFCAWTIPAVVVRGRPPHRTIASPGEELARRHHSAPRQGSSEQSGGRSGVSGTTGVDRSGISSQNASDVRWVTEEETTGSTTRSCCSCSSELLTILHGQTSQTASR